MRRYARTFTLQRATLTDDGLGTATTWADDGTLTGAVLPATRSALERASLLSVRATHQMLAPRGHDLSPADTRLKDGSTIYSVRDVETGPKYDRVLLEVTS